MQKGGHLCFLLGWEAPRLGARERAARCAEKMEVAPKLPELELELELQLDSEEALPSESSSSDCCAWTPLIL